MWRETGLMNLDEIGTVLAAHNHEWRPAVQQRLDEIAQQQQRLSAARAMLEHLLTCPDPNPAEACPYLRVMTGDRVITAGEGTLSGTAGRASMTCSHGPIAAVVMVPSRLLRSE